MHDIVANGLSRNPAACTGSEIGIRMAVGAPTGGIARLVTVDIFSMVLRETLTGLVFGMASLRYIETLF
jgi:hypothetical protein